MESQPQNPEFSINPETFTHADVQARLSLSWSPLCDRNHTFVCMPISIMV